MATGLDNRNEENQSIDEGSICNLPSLTVTGAKKMALFQYSWQ